MFFSLRSAIAPVHSALGLANPDLMPASRADMQEPMSPITGAAIATLLSTSVGEMSTWMNCFGAPQVLPLPCESSQFRRAPTIMTTSASASTKERQAEADWAWVSGNRPLAMDIGR